MKYLLDGGAGNLKDGGNFGDRNMTRNHHIKDFDSRPIMKVNDDDMCTVSLDWVSHGNFALRSHGQYFCLETEHFQEILDAYENAPKSSGRKPFWTGDVPARGMSFGHLIEAYAFESQNKYIKFIESTCDVMGINAPHYHAQVTMEVETFKKISDEVDSVVADQEKNAETR